MQKDNNISVQQLLENINQSISQYSHIGFSIEGQIINVNQSANGNIFAQLSDGIEAIDIVVFNYRNENIKQNIKRSNDIRIYGKIMITGNSYKINVFNSQVINPGKDKVVSKVNLPSKKNEKKLTSIAVKKVGIITSETGAALQDIKAQFANRFPIAFEVYNSVMQGKSALESIMKGLTYFESDKAIDIILISRGGGSEADFQIFNDKEICFRIAHSKKYIITALGHHENHTYADKVSSLSCSTPSSAAIAISTPTLIEIKDQIEFLKKQIHFTKKEFISKVKFYKSENKNLLFAFQQKIKNIASYKQIEQEKLLQTLVKNFNQYINYKKSDLNTNSVLVQKSIEQKILNMEKQFNLLRYQFKIKTNNILNKVILKTYRENSRHSKLIKTFFINFYKSMNKKDS